MAAFKQSLWPDVMAWLKNKHTRKRVNEQKSQAPHANPTPLFCWAQRFTLSDPATGELVEHFLIKRLILVLGSRGEKNVATDELVHHLTVHLGAGERQTGLISKFHCNLKQKIQRTGSENMTGMEQSYIMECSSTLFPQPYLYLMQVYHISNYKNLTAGIYVECFRDMASV